MSVNWMNQAKSEQDNVERKLEEKGVIRVTGIDPEEYLHFKDLLRLENRKDDEFLAQVPDREMMEMQLFKLAERIRVPRSMQTEMINEILQETYDYGIITELKARPKVTTIWIAGDQWIEYREGGEIFRYDKKFDSLSDLYRFVERKLDGTPFRFSRTAPSVDAILADGSRFHVKGATTGITVTGPNNTRRVYQCPMVTIRQFVYPYKLSSIVRNKVMHKYLSLLPQLGESLVVSGSQESGKTTLLNALTEYLPDHTRLIIIEEAPEMQPKYGHAIRMWNRLGNDQNVGLVTMITNVKDSLRMTGDVMIIGEIRDADTLMRFLETANIGLDFVGTTIHASSAEDTILRMKMLGLSAPDHPAEKTIAYQISRGITHIVFMDRQGANRGISQILEITGFNASTGDVETRMVFERDMAKGQVRYFGISDRMKKKALDNGIPIDELLPRK